jgi:hypothetical protein
MVREDNRNAAPKGVIGILVIFMYNSLSLFRCRAVPDAAAATHGINSFCLLAGETFDGNKKVLLPKKNRACYRRNVSLHRRAKCISGRQ